MRITRGAFVRHRTTGQVGRVRRVRGSRARVAWAPGQRAEDTPVADLEALRPGR